MVSLPPSQEKTSFLNGSTTLTFWLNVSVIRRTFFSGIKWTPSGCYSFASCSTPSLSPKLCKFLGFVSPPTTDLELINVFMLIALIEEDSESATKSSI